MINYFHSLQEDSYFLIVLFLINFFLKLALKICKLVNILLQFSSSLI